MLSAASFAINVGNDTSMFRHWIGWFFWHAQMTQRQKMVLKACWRARAVSCCTDKCKIEVKINPKSKVKLITSILEVFFSWNRLRASNIKGSMKTLSGCAGRALAAVIKEIDSCQDLGSQSCTGLFKSWMCPVLDNSAGLLVAAVTPGPGRRATWLDHGAGLSTCLASVHWL